MEWRRTRCGFGVTNEKALHIAGLGVELCTTRQRYKSGSIKTHTIRKEYSPMLRKRGKRWHYQFVADGRTYSGSTGYEATKRNANAARLKEPGFR